MAFEHNGEDGVFTESVMAMAAEAEEDGPYLEGDDPLEDDAGLFAEGAEDYGDAGLFAEGAEDDGDAGLASVGLGDTGPAEDGLGDIGLGSDGLGAIGLGSDGLGDAGFAGGALGAAGSVAVVGVEEPLAARVARLEAAARELAAAEVTREQRRVQRKVGAATTGAGAVGFLPILLQLAGAIDLPPALAATASTVAAIVGAFAAGWATPEREPPLPPSSAHALLDIGRP